MNRRQLFVIVVILAGLLGCSEKTGNRTLVYQNDFEGGAIGPEWKNEGGDWVVEEGTLRSKSAKNKDLVLNQPIPKEAEIELEMISHSPDVDIKFRAWGDPTKDMHDGAYHFILGGWKNSISTIAPLGEHDPRRIEKKEKLQAEHWYKVRVVRKDGRITLFLDGKEYLAYKDEANLDFEKYQYFSFANWKTHCEFDNLRIYSVQ